MAVIERIEKADQLLENVTYTSIPDSAAVMERRRNKVF
jgi:hypothetical protein